jgi:hypothetical protein
VNTKAAAGLTAGALVVGLLAGLGLGHDSDKGAKPIGPGPTKTVAGIPVGYAHSQDGAVAAAANYAESIGPLALATNEDRDAAIALCLTPLPLGRSSRGFSPDSMLWAQV